MDPIESEPFGNFTFRYLREEDLKPALEHLMDVLLRCFDLYGYNRTEESDWRTLFGALLESSIGFSFLVIDNSTGKIVGARVLVLKKRGEPDSHPTFTYPKNEDIYDYFVGLADRLNVWEAYPDVNEYIEMFGISVCPEYRKQGIAKEIYRRVLALMKVRGIKVARCGFTSPFSRKAAKSQGCKIFVEEPVCQAKLKDGRYLNSSAAPEDISDYGVFEVDLN